MTALLAPEQEDRFDAGMRALTAALEAELPQAAETRQALHAAARLSGEEEDSAEMIARMMGVEMTVVADTGRVARIGPGAGAAIAIRAELDALPMVEQTGVAWASGGGAMHACGHDVHQAALVALVRAAKRIGNELPVAMVPMLQPREESYPSGAQDIVESGCLDELGVTAVIGAHVHPRVETGKAAVGSGPINAAADTVEIRFSGGGGHGAYPHEASSPVLAIAHTVVELEGLVRRVVSPMHPAVVSVGRIRSGEAANVVPAGGILSATVRTMRQEDRERLLEAIAVVADRQAAVHGVVAKVSVSSGEPVLENTPALVEEFHRLSLEAGRAMIEPLRSCGSDDFSFYSARYSSLMSFVGVETAGVVPQPSLHHASFLPTERAVADVARTLLQQYRAAAADIVGRNAAGGPSNPVEEIHV